MCVRERERVCVSVTEWVSRVLAVRPSPAAPLLLKPPLDWRQKKWCELLPLLPPPLPCAPGHRISPFRRDRHENKQSVFTLLDPKLWGQMNEVK